MDEIVGILLYIARGLLWLVVDLCFFSVAWRIGWGICRLCTFGRLPTESISDYEEASFTVVMVVGAIGIVFLVLLVYLLSQFV